MGIMLVVDHLSIQFSSADLRAMVERHAPLLKCWVVQKPGGGSLQFGYIEVPTVSDAEAVIRGLRGVVLDGKPVSITVLETA